MVKQARALHKFSDMLTLSQSGGADYAQPLALPHLKCFVITPLIKSVVDFLCNNQKKNQPCSFINLPT
jgi:hypothetical protein